MTTLFTYSGAGANENPLAGVWSTVSGFNPFERISNVLNGTVDSANNGSYVNSVGDQAACWIQAEVATTTPTSVALWLRCPTGAANGYVFQVYSGTAQIARWDVGSYNVLVSDSAPVTLGDVMYFEAIGDALVAKINDVEVLSTNDATYASGRFALYSYSDVDSFVNVAAGNFGDVKTVNGVPVADVKTINGVVAGSVKTLNGVPF